MGLADCWREEYSTDRREVVAAEACFPIDVTEGLSSDDWQHWRVADATVWLQQWLSHSEQYAAREEAAGEAPSGGDGGTSSTDITDGQRGAAGIGT